VNEPLEFGCEVLSTVDSTGVPGFVPGCIVHVFVPPSPNVHATTLLVLCWLYFGFVCLTMLRGESVLDLSMFIVNCDLSLRPVIRKHVYVTSKFCPVIYLRAECFTYVRHEKLYLRIRKHCF